MGFFSKIIGAAAPIVGGIVGGPAGAAIGAGLGGALSSQDAQNFSSAQAGASRAFTETQLKNRHQWEVADLRAAGLNPVLSAMKGAPSIGGSASASQPQSSASDAAGLTHSASQMHQQKLNSKKIQAEIDLLRANAGASKSQSIKNIADAGKSQNVGDISKNLSNLSTGFHGLTNSAGKTMSKHLDDLKNLPSLIKRAIKHNKSKGLYDMPWKKKGK